MNTDLENKLQILNKAIDKLRRRIAFLEKKMGIWDLEPEIKEINET